MRFLLTNDGVFRNKGNEAITKSIVNGILNLNPHAFFEIFTNDPTYDAFYIARTENVSFLAQPFKIWFPFTRWWHYLIISKLGLSASIRMGMDAFRSTDVVLSAAGDNFSSTYGALYQNVAFIQTALAFKKPVLLIGSSIGPFENEKEYTDFVKTVRNVPLITVRESVSLKYLQSMNLKNTRIEPSADPAFCLEPNTENIERIWKTYNLPTDKKIVAVAPSQGITHYVNNSYSGHLKTLQALVEFLIRERGFHVILIPHVHHMYAINDDRIICETIYRNLNFPEEVTVINLGHTAEEIRAIISRSEIMIAERMHAAIASLSQNVPTFVIGYSVKYEGILGDIFGFDNLEDYLIHIEKLNVKILKERVKNLLDRRKEVARYLSKVMPGVKENAKRNFTLIMDVLGQKKYESF